MRPVSSAVASRIVRSHLRPYSQANSFRPFQTRRTASSFIPPSSAPSQIAAAELEQVLRGPWMASTQAKRPLGEAAGGWPKKFKKAKRKPVKEGSAEEVLLADIRSLLEAQKLTDAPEVGEAKDGEAAEGAEAPALPDQGSEIDVEVVELSSTGDALARQPGSSWIYVVPFSVPGDTVRVKVYRHLRQDQYSVADFISVAKPSPLRDNGRIQCKYFGKCSGCQFQMLDYAEQLRLKRTIVDKAYRNFSQLPPELVPPILDTIGSPLQYGYRTKLTPHFDGPPGFARRGRGKRQPLQEVPDIGFMQKGTRRTLDIEDCPIGTEAVRRGMKRERERIATEFGKYERGATILLRENTQRTPKTDDAVAPPALPADLPPDAVVVEADTHTDVKTCITDGNATSTEYIDSFVFTNPANFFFQNNNSILPVFTSYIREHILPPPAPAHRPIRYLIDAYSGSGLFTITLSSLFPGGSTGIDIADKSIAFARRNATLNGLDEAQCRFIAADAPELFKSVAAYDPDETVVVLDPPRKGCDASFLRQLLRFAPRRVIYVSCNVHTQARDVGMLVRGEVDFPGDKGGGEGEEERRGGAAGVRYSIESLRGFDFFPQTGHVEGVAVLNRVDAPAPAQEAAAA